jgi:aminoglycoside 6'-N-acetyltransferase
MNGPRTSGEQASSPRVDLRPLERADLPLLGQWLREPAVERWWHDDPSPAALERQYGAAIDGLEATHLLLASADGEPAGFLQWYRLQDEPSYLAELRALPGSVPDDAVSLDYLVGVARWRRRGVGRAMIAAALERAWRSGAAAAVVPVHEENLASRAVLERCGFVAVAHGELEPDNPVLSRRHVVYRLDRPRSPAAG